MAACTSPRRSSRKQADWSAAPKHALDQVHLAEMAVEVGDSDRGEVDPPGQPALATDRVIVLGTAAHLGEKARRLVLGEARIVRGRIGDGVEERLVLGGEPGLRFGVPR